TGGASGATGGAPATTGGASGTGGSGSGTGGGAAAGTGGAGPGASGGSAGGLGGGGAPAGTGGGAAGGAAGGGAPTGACPANATFCSGFETAGLPTGAVYKANAAPGEWTRDFVLDTTIRHAGAASLRVKTGAEAGTSGSAYKMLSVPAPAAAFWVRFYMRSEIDLGGEGHNPFAGASGSDEPNDGVMVEFAEDVGIAFNSHDDVIRPDGFSRTMPYTLPKDTWHCVEISYDSATRNQKLFINNMALINVPSWPMAGQVGAGFKVFKFGFNELHGPPRKTWYDEVAVAAQRIGCP
ncbi:MAG: hypothetical protein ABUR63_07325, partial [Verrucomicrobiota bacterium]